MSEHTHEVTDSNFEESVLSRRSPFWLISGRSGALRAA